MVAKIITGKTIRGVLSYNEIKVRNAEAILLMAAGYPRDPGELTFRNKLERLELLTRQNEKTKTNAVHISLNFSARDNISDTLLKKIAAEYMDRIGFGRQPYLVYRHLDTAHPHIHIATVNIADGGQRIETHNIGKNQSERARKELEQYYGLIRAEDQTKEKNYQTRLKKLTKPVYGKEATKATISDYVREVVDTYKFTSLPELNALLGQFNILADRGEVGTRMYEKGGLVYTMLDDNGQRIGKPIKASTIYTAPTLANLELKFIAGKGDRKPYGQRLKHLLDKALVSSRTLEDYREALRKQGIRILLRENIQGNIYGTTFIDNATRTIFNGSDLGKQYAAQAFIESIGKLGFSIDWEREQWLAQRQQDKPDDAYESPPYPAIYPAQEQAVIDIIWNASSPDKQAENIKNTIPKKRKRLGME